MPKRLDPDRHAAFQIVALANRISSSASQAYLRHFGIGVMEWRCLAMIGRTPGTSANEIAQLSGLDKSSVSRAVSALTGKGEVLSAADPADSRRSLLKLTPAGEALHDRVLEASLDREQRLLAGLSGAERDQLFVLLARLSDNMTQVDAHAPAGTAEVA